MDSVWHNLSVIANNLLKITTPIQTVNYIGIGSWVAYKNS